VTDSRLRQSIRWAAVIGLLAASAAHLPVIPEHLREAPYMGAAFIAFSLAALMVAVLIALRPGMAGYRSAGMLCAAAVLVYSLTRLVAFPQLADDVGNWSETLGLVSIASEGFVVVIAAIGLSSPWHRKTVAPSFRSGPLC